MDDRTRFGGEIGWDILWEKKVILTSVFEVIVEEKTRRGRWFEETGDSWRY